MAKGEIAVSKQLKIALKEDNVFRRSMKKFEDIDKDVDKWLDEIQSLHVRRGVRALSTGRLLESAQVIAIDTDIDEMAISSRVTEIKARALRQILTIDETLERLKKYVRFKYATILAGEKTVTERKAIVEDILHSAIGAKRRLEGVMKMGDLVLDDAKQASYGLSRINAILVARQKER